VGSININHTETGCEFWLLQPQNMVQWRTVMNMVAKRRVILRRRGLGFPELAERLLTSKVRLRSVELIVYYRLIKDFRSVLITSSGTN
jgi:hypothetical protein